VDKKTWAEFIRSSKRITKMICRKEPANHINFKAGGQPSLPFNGHKSLRLGSSVSETIVTSSERERCINTMASVAQCHFGAHRSIGTSVPTTMEKGAVTKYTSLSGLTSMLNHVVLVRLCCSDTKFGAQPDQPETCTTVARRAQRQRSVLKT